MNRKVTVVGGGNVGATLAQRLADRELADVVLRAGQSTQQIAAAVRQHLVGTEQIAVAMGNINQSSAQNLAATTNTRRAAENMTDLVERLNVLVARYRV